MSFPISKPEKRFNFKRRRSCRPSCATRAIQRPVLHFCEPPQSDKQNLKKKTKFTLCPRASDSSSSSSFRQWPNPKPVQARNALTKNLSLSLSLSPSYFKPWRWFSTIHHSLVFSLRSITEEEDLLIEILIKISISPPVLSSV